MRTIFFCGIVLVSICCTHSVQAQLYHSALGLRLGANNGLTFKTFVNSKAAIEAIATFRYQGIGLTGLYEVHGRAFHSRDFAWYIGGGGHVYMWGDKHPAFLDANRHAIVGLDGIIGLEGKFQTIPLAVSLDWKPSLHIVNYNGFWGDEIALSFRFTF